MQIPGGGGGGLFLSQIPGGGGGEEGTIPIADPRKWEEEGTIPIAEPRKWWEDGTIPIAIHGHLDLIVNYLDKIKSF